MSPTRWDAAPWSQWYQTYYEFRDARLYLCHNDNKDQHYDESEIDLDGFLAKHAESTEEPFPAIVAFIRAQQRPESGAPDGWVRSWGWPGNTAFFNERFSAWASARGLSYSCRIDGPFCGDDPEGSQSWEEFEAWGPPTRVIMPASITDEIRAHLAAQRSLHARR